MITSHNSFTYLKPKNKLLNLISFWWKCQNLNIEEQYKLGVRIFDIRIYRYNDWWGVSHGYAKFDFYFNTISDIYEYFNSKYPNSILRIILEDKEDHSGIFVNEAYEAYSKYADMTWEIGTHHPWRIYYRNHFFTINEYYCHPLKWNTDRSFLYNIKHLNLSHLFIKNYAKKHNIPITNKLINDKEMYIFDYIGLHK